MKLKISLAVAALLATSVQGVSIKSDLGMGNDLSEMSNVDASSELGRFVGPDGQAINLAETKGHARLVLSQKRKYDMPMEETNLLLDEFDPKKCDREGGANHCPINKNGTGGNAVHLLQKNLEDNAYVSDIYVGNPPQKVRALFDTGSTNTWILNSKVELPNGATKEFSYNDGESCSAHKLDQRAMIQFGSGALAGHFMTDDIRVGTCDDKSSGQIHIKDQKFGNVEKQSTIFTGSNFEAIVGMAYPALAEKGVKPVFDEMIDQHLLKNNVFAFYLTSKQAENLGFASDLTFGYYDKAKFKGAIHWNPILFKYMFGVKLDDIKVNGKSTGVCQGKECLITFDSGTSLMSMPHFATDILQKNKIPTSNTI